jgi:transcriptional regulator with XRE-family HTH domain
MTNKDQDLLKKFGTRIKVLRLKKGITSQISLANKAGLDRTYIGGVERGERNIALINISKLAKALEVEISDLVNF